MGTTARALGVFTAIAAAAAMTACSSAADAGEDGAASGSDRQTIVFAAIPS
ncbi:MAG: hypothetical protein GX542_12430, partial [Rhodococcus sp.]|nr:hypothetical protein [Rhodococcus sp. (in: high G+C Gram-positive bacteria)]